MYISLNICILGSVWRIVIAKDDHVHAEMTGSPRLGISFAGRYQCMHTAQADHLMKCQLD